jgi:hypothetical protein
MEGTARTIVAPPNQAPISNEIFFERFHLADLLARAKVCPLPIGNTRHQCPFEHRRSPGPITSNGARLLPPLLQVHSHGVRPQGSPYRTINTKHDY